MYNPMLDCNKFLNGCVYAISYCEILLKDNFKCDSKSSEINKIN